MEKAVFCDNNDKIDGFEYLPYFQIRLDLDHLSLDAQFRILREFQPINLSPWRDNNHLPYIQSWDRWENLPDGSFVPRTRHHLPEKIKEGFERLDHLWRDDCPMKSFPCDVMWSPARSSGNLFPRFLIVGLNPGVGDYLKTGSWGAFWTGDGPSTQTLRKALIKLDIHSECWITNLVRCATAKNLPPTHVEHECCYKEWLAKEIFWLKPQAIITLGRDATSALSSILPTELHAPIFPVKHPAYYVRIGKPNEYVKEFEAIIA